jgi:hypothetical protein
MYRMPALPQRRRVLQWLLATFGGAGLFGCGGGDDAKLDDLQRAANGPRADDALDAATAADASIDITFDALLRTFQRSRCEGATCSELEFRQDLSIPFSTAFSVGFDAEGSFEVTEEPTDGRIQTTATHDSYFRTSVSSDLQHLQSLLSMFGATLTPPGLPPPSGFDVAVKVALQRITFRDVATNAVELTIIGAEFQRELRFTQLDEHSNAIGALLTTNVRLFGSVITTPDVRRRWTQQEFSAFLLAAQAALPNDTSIRVGYDVLRPGNIEDRQLLSGVLVRVAEVSGSGLCR